MKLKQKFAIIVSITIVQVLLLVVLILNSSSKMQKMKNYQYVQATLEVDLGNTINLLNQVDYWGFDNTTVANEFSDNIESLAYKYAFISTDSILNSFPESFVQSLSEQTILWNAFSTKFALISSSLEKIQNMNLPQDIAVYVTSDGIRAAYELFPNDPNTKELIIHADKIHKNMASVIRSGKRLAKLNAQCAVAINDIIIDAEKKAKLYSLAMAVLACILMAVLILIVTGRIAKRIIKIRDKTSVLAAKDFTTSIKPEGSGEMRSLMENINNMVNQLNDFFIVVKNTASKAIVSSSSINDSVNITADATGKIDSNIDDINKEFEEITKSIQLTISAITDMNDHVSVLVENNEKQTSSIEESNNAVNGAATTLEYINQMAMQRTKSAEEMHALVADGDSKINQTGAVLNNITGQLDKVREIVTIINRVSAKTNLLSMNAGIEAVHAGEAGKGFGVVAGEIRALAEETSKNAVLIEGVVKNIVDSVSEANSSSAAASTAFIKVRENADEIIKSLQEITNGVGSIDSQMHQIKDKSEETACAADEINTYCTNLAHRQQEVSAQVDSMNELILRTKESIFQIKKGTANIVERIDDVRYTSNESYQNMSDLENILDEFKTKTVVEKSDDEEINENELETDSKSDINIVAESVIPEIEEPVEEIIDEVEEIDDLEDVEDIKEVETEPLSEPKSFNGGDDDDFFIDSVDAMRANLTESAGEYESEEDEDNLYPDDLEALVKKNNDED